MKMKLILLIISLIFIIKLNNATLLNNNKYINFQVFNDESCTEQSNYGNGYSSLINNCITIDQQNHFIFSIKNKIIKWDIVKQCNSNLQSSNVVQSRSYPVNSCIPSNVIDLDANTDASYKPFYYKLSTSSKPVIPPNAFVKSLMKNQCSEHYQTIIEYFINGTSVNENGNSIYYYCSADSNKPSIQRCPLSSNVCIKESDLEQPCKLNGEDKSNSGTGWPNFSSGLVNNDKPNSDGKSNSGTGWPNFSSGLVNGNNNSDRSNSGTGWPNFSSGLVHEIKSKQIGGHKFQNNYYYNVYCS